MAFVAVCPSGCFFWKVVLQVGNALQISSCNLRIVMCFTLVANSLGIHLLFLPPYSPNRNVIERHWKFTKKNILYAKYYQNPKALHEAVETFFQNINQNFKPALETLLSLNFQFFDKTNSTIYTLWSIAFVCAFDVSRTTELLFAGENTLQRRTSPATYCAGTVCRWKHHAKAKIPCDL